MKTALRIPSQLFLTAGKAIEDALREATFDALQEHDLRNPIATWEDGKVVFIYRRDALDKILAQRPDTASNDAYLKRLISRHHRMFLDWVFESALQIYIKDDKLHLEYLYKKHWISDFLVKPENAHILQNICRAITGREMEAQLIFVKDQTHHKELSSARRLIGALMRPLDTVRSRDSQSLAARRATLQPRPIIRKIEDSSPDSLPVPQTVPAEGDDLSSQKGE